MAPNPDGLRRVTTHKGGAMAIDIQATITALRGQLVNVRCALWETETKKNELLKQELAIAERLYQCEAIAKNSEHKKENE